MSVVLGVDPSLTVSGCALVQWEQGSADWTTWRGRTSPAEKVTVASTRRRIRLMLRAILDQVPSVLTLSVVEGPAMGAKHTPLADERAGLRWMLIDQLSARGPVALVSPTARQVLARSEPVPRGTKPAARKGLVLAAVRALVPDAEVPDHNVADAVALAAAGAHRVGLSLPYTDKQISAHGKVPWPVEGGHVLAGMEKG